MTCLQVPGGHQERGGGGLSHCGRGARHVPGQLMPFHSPFHHYNALQYNMFSPWHHDTVSTFHQVEFQWVYLVTDTTSTSMDMTPFIQMARYPTSPSLSPIHLYAKSPENHYTISPIHQYLTHPGTVTTWPSCSTARWPGRAWSVTAGSSAWSARP